MTKNQKKLNRNMAVCIVLGIGALLLLLVVLTGIQKNASIGKVRDCDEAAAYLLELGWEVDSSTAQIQDSVLPEYFDRTFDAYNQLQKEQNFDLNQYAGQPVTVYTFQVINYPNTDQEVLACLMTCKSRVIGGDIHSAALDGFMHALKSQPPAKPEA